MAAARMDGELKQLLGSVLADRYRIDAVLGVGGMGAVFRAHHLLLRRDVAIKVLHPKLSRHSQIRRRFDREAQSSARLAHPNIVRVTEFGSLPDDTKYLVMELLEGHELHTLLGEPLAPKRAAELILQIVLALEHAHAKGVVHRDLKPENIFVTRNHEGHEVLKLVDFGVAKMFDAEHEQEGQKALTRMGLVFGTPKYMSPEQAMGLPVDARTDLYAAGAILYEMLAGRPPLTHDDPVALVRMQVSVDPVPLDESIPLELRKIVERLLAKDRNDRYAEAHQVRHDLEIALSRLQNSDRAGSPLTPEAQQAWFAATQSGVRAVEPAANLSVSRLGDATDSDWNATVVQPNQSLSSKRVRFPWAWTIGLSIAGVAIGTLFSPMLGVNEIEDSAPTVVDSKEKVQVKQGYPNNVEDKYKFAAIDRLILSKNRKGALAMIREQPKDFRKNPDLLWREGKALALGKRGKEQKKAFELYSRALRTLDSEIQADTESEAETEGAGDQEGEGVNERLLNNPEFFAELSKLLNSKKLRVEAIELAITTLGKSGHTFLLRLINDPDKKNELKYEDRHKILSYLEKHDEAYSLVDKKLNLVRDLRQARLSERPCTSLHSALKEINTSKELSYLEELRQVDMAPFQDEMDVSEEEKAACTALPDVMTTLIALLENLQASEIGETGELPPDGSGASNDASDLDGINFLPTASNSDHVKGETAKKRSKRSKSKGRDADGVESHSKSKSKGKTSSLKPKIRAEKKTSGTSIGPQSKHFLTW